MRRILLGISLFALVLTAPVFGLSTSNAQDEGDNVVHLTGYFNLQFGEHHARHYALYEPASGNQYVLHGAGELVAGLGGYFGLLGKEILVTGTVDDVGMVIQVSDLQLAVITPFDHIDLIDDRHWIGEQHYLNALCRFPDSEGDPPADESYFQNELLPVLNQFWGENSYGQAELAFTTEGWFDLPEDWEYYIEGDLGLGEWTDQIMQHCVSAAVDNGVDVHQFDGINLMFDRELDGNSYGNVRTFEADGEVGTWGITWMAQHHWQLSETNTRPLYVMLHEFGHSLGLPHSCSSPDQAYGSQWDVMSNEVLAHTIAFHRDKLGWIDEDDKYFPTNDPNQVIFLERLGHPDMPLGDNEYLMVEVPVPSDDRYYTAEARMQFGDFESTLPSEQSVIMHEIDLERQVPHPITGDVRPDCQAVLVTPFGMGPNIGDFYDFPDEDFEMFIAPMHEAETGSWVVINPDLELEVNAPATAIAGEDFDIEISLTADGESVDFAEGWTIFTSVQAVDRPTLDENGETTITLNREATFPVNTTIRLGYLTQDVTVEILPAEPHFVAIEAFPANQTVGGDVSLHAVVEDEFGNRVADGTEVTFDIDGSTAEAPVRTDGGSGLVELTNNGAVALRYTRFFPGTDRVSASAGDNPVVTSGELTIEWALPEQTVGTMVIANQFFSFHTVAAALSPSGAAGMVSYRDGNVNISSREVATVTIDGDRAIIYARPTRGSAEFMRIDLIRGENVARIRLPNYDTGYFGIHQVLF